MPIKQPSKTDDENTEKNDKNADESQDDNANNAHADTQDKFIAVSEQTPTQASMSDDTLTTPLLVKHYLLHKCMRTCLPQCYCLQSE